MAGLVPAGRRTPHGAAAGGRDLPAGRPGRRRRGRRVGGVADVPRLAGHAGGPRAVAVGGGGVRVPWLAAPGGRCLPPYPVARGAAAGGALRGRARLGHALGFRRSPGVRCGGGAADHPHGRTRGVHRPARAEQPAGLRPVRRVRGRTGVRRDGGGRHLATGPRRHGLGAALRRDRAVAGTATPPAEPVRPGPRADPAPPPAVLIAPGRALAVRAVPATGAGCVRAVPGAAGHVRAVPAAARVAWGVPAAGRTGGVRSAAGRGLAVRLTAGQPWTVRTAALERGRPRRRAVRPCRARIRRIRRRRAQPRRTRVHRVQPGLARRRTRP